MQVSSWGQWLLLDYAFKLMGIESEELLIREGRWSKALEMQRPDQAGSPRRDKRRCAAERSLRSEETS